MASSCWVPICQVWSLGSSLQVYLAQSPIWFNEASSHVMVARIAARGHFRWALQSVSLYVELRFESGWIGICSVPQNYRLGKNDAIFGFSAPNLSQGGWQNVGELDKKIDCI